MSATDDRGTVRLPVALRAKLEQLRARVAAAGGVPATLPQTALAILDEAVDARLAQTPPPR